MKRFTSPIYIGLYDMNLDGDVNGRLLLVYEMADYIRFLGSGCGFIFLNCLYGITKVYNDSRWIYRCCYFRECKIHNMFLISKDFYDNSVFCEYLVCSLKNSALSSG